MPQLLRKSAQKSKNDDLTPIGSDDEGGLLDSGNKNIRNVFPENQMKNEIVRNLYKRAATEEQRQELDLMVNDVKYTELKRQKR